MTGVFEGVGTLQYTPDNKRCYGYSGDKTVNGSLVTMLEFKTNSEYLEIQIEHFGAISQIGQSQIRNNVTFNDIDILDNYYDASLDGGFNGWDFPTQLIVPPFTTVKINMSQAEGSSKTMQTAVTGKVYGAIEQQNLEAITDNNKWASK